MLDKGIRVIFVTHMYDLAHSFHAHRLENGLFLRAEPEADGRRAFKLPGGQPLPTSYGRDSYRRIFGEGDAGLGVDRPTKRGAGAPLMRCVSSTIGSPRR